RSRSVGGRFRCEVPERPATSCAFVVQGGSAKKTAGTEELGSADSEPEEGDPPLFRAAEIARGARPQPRENAPCTLGQEGPVHGASVGSGSVAPAGLACAGLRPHFLPVKFPRPVILLLA